MKKTSDLQLICGNSFVLLAVECTLNKQNLFCSDWEKDSEAANKELSFMEEIIVFNLYYDLHVKDYNTKKDHQNR